jgi:hypothetical protein
VSSRYLIRSVTLAFNRSCSSADATARVLRTMSEFRRKGRVPIAVGLLSLGLALLDTSACNPDSTKEICYTLEEWKTARGCVKFPDAADGVCPPAADVEKGCSWQVVGARTAGEKCCYTMPTASY